MYCAGLNPDPSAFTSVPQPRVGTTGAKIPENVFGGMKTATFSIGGNHDGVGTVQTSLHHARVNFAALAQKDPRSTYEMTETAEQLLSFLLPQQQVAFLKQLHYQLTQSEIPDELIKQAVLSEMAPFKDSATLHYFKPDGVMKVKDPMKSFLRMAERTLGWTVKEHAGYDALNAWVTDAADPVYFYAAHEKRIIPGSFLAAVASRGGFVYSGFSTDPVENFSRATTTQAWTVGVAAAEEAEGAKALLRQVYREECLKDREVAVEVSKAPAPAQFEDSDEEEDWGSFDAAEDSTKENVDPAAMKEIEEAAARAKAAAQAPADAK